jgi:hypothetical protein
MSDAVVHALAVVVAVWLGAHVFEGLRSYMRRREAGAPWVPGRSRPDELPTAPGDPAQPAERDAPAAAGAEPPGAEPGHDERH